MRRSPYRHHRHSHQRRQMHVHAVHRQHHVAVAQQRQLYGESVAFFAQRDGVGIFLYPFFELTAFIIALSEEKQLHTLPSGNGVEHLFHEMNWIDFASPLGIWRHGNPALAGSFRANHVCECLRIALAAVENRRERLFESKPHSAEHLAIAVERRAQRKHALVAAAREGLLALVAHVDALHFAAAQPHCHAQQPRAAVALKVNHGIGLLLACQPLCQPQHAAKAAICLVMVNCHHAKILWSIEKQCRRHLLSDNHKLRFGVCHAHRVDNRYGHSHIAQQRKANYQHLAIRCRSIDNRCG